MAILCLLFFYITKNKTGLRGWSCLFTTAIYLSILLVVVFEIKPLVRRIKEKKKKAAAAAEVAADISESISVAAAAAAAEDGGGDAAADGRLLSQLRTVANALALVGVFAVLFTCEDRNGNNLLLARLRLFNNNNNNDNSSSSGSSANNQTHQ